MRFSSFIVVAAVLVGACHKPADSRRGLGDSVAAKAARHVVDVVPHPPSGSLLGSLQSQLQRVNPSIRLVEVYDIEHISITDSTWYVLLALGHGDHRGWADSSQVGEIFGVFGVDSGLTHVTRVYGMFPNPRLGDYALWIDHGHVPDSIVLVGKGATYGDLPMRRAYARWTDE